MVMNMHILLWIYLEKGPLWHYINESYLYFFISLVAEMNSEGSGNEYNNLSNQILTSAPVTRNFVHNDQQQVKEANMYNAHISIQFLL